MNSDYESKLRCSLQSTHLNSYYGIDQSVNSALVEVPNTNEISWQLKAIPSDGLYLIVNSTNEVEMKDLSLSILITIENSGYVGYTHSSEFIALKCTTVSIGLGTFQHTSGSKLSFPSIYQNCHYNLVVNASLNFKISPDVLTDDPHSLLADIRAEDLTDFTIQIGSKSWKAHKLLLAARSSVFGRMLANKDCNEYKQSLLKIVDVSEDIFELFIEFLYTDRIPNLSLTQATDVLIVADKYDVKKLKQMCDNMLVTILKATDPVHDVFQLAHALNCSHELKKKAFGFVKSTIFASFLAKETLSDELVDEPEKVKTLVDKLKDLENTLKLMNQPNPKNPNPMMPNPELQK